MEFTRDETNLLLYLVKCARDESRGNATKFRHDSNNESDQVTKEFYNNRTAQCESILETLRAELY